MGTLNEHPDWTWRKFSLAPAQQLENLARWCSELPEGQLQTAGERILDILREAYATLQTRVAKKDAIEEVLWPQANSVRGRKIAVIVHLAGFKTLCNRLGWPELARQRHDTLEIATPGTFQPTPGRYDLIVSIGGMEGKCFSPFFCTCADSVLVLMYGCELADFRRNAKNAIRREKRLSGEEASSEEKQAFRAAQQDHQEIQWVHDIEDELRKFRESENWAIVGRIRRTAGQSDQESEVAWIGTLETGEKVFFTKFARPYVLVSGSGELRERRIEEVSSGDRILFMQNNNARHDIIDTMLQDRIAQGGSEGLAEAFRKSKRWRQLLKTYAAENQVSAADMAKKMGNIVHEVTIKSWMDEDAHIVGPRKADCLRQIADLVGDQEMRDSFATYENACRIIRHERLELLNELGRQIRNNMNNAEFQTMVRLCILEDLRKAPVDLTLPTWCVNHPISIDEEEGEQWTNNT